jgi:hypothetical protein
MMPKPLKQTATQPTCFAGIDVGTEEQVMLLHIHEQHPDNDPIEHN